jgi:hypothetical protein
MISAVFLFAEGQDHTCLTGLPPKLWNTATTLRQRVGMRPMQFIRGGDQDVGTQIVYDATSDHWTIRTKDLIHGACSLKELVDDWTD